MAERSYFTSYLVFPISLQSACTPRPSSIHFYPYLWEPSFAGLEYNSITKDNNWKGPSIIVQKMERGWAGFPESKKIWFFGGNRKRLFSSIRWGWWCRTSSLPFCRVSFHHCQVQAHLSQAQLYTSFPKILNSQSRMRMPKPQLNASWPKSSPFYLPVNLDLNFLENPQNEASGISPSGPQLLW